MPRLGAVKPETVLHITLKYYLCGDATATTGPDTVACGQSPEGDGLWILQSELLALFLWKLDGLPSASLEWLPQRASIWTSLSSDSKFSTDASDGQSLNHVPSPQQKKRLEISHRNSSFGRIPSMVTSYHGSPGIPYYSGKEFLKRND